MQYIGFNRIYSMELTEAQQKYFAYWLTSSLTYDNLGKFTASLQDAQVDLTTRSTLFFLRSCRHSQRVQFLPMGSDLVKPMRPALYSRSFGLNTATTC